MIPDFRAYYQGVSTQPNPVQTADHGEDGRSARRTENIRCAIEAGRQLFEETGQVPTIEQVAQRAAVSLRSMYRYFASIDELADAVINLVQNEARIAGRLHLGQDAPLADRIDEIVRSRVMLHQLTKGSFRANMVRVLAQAAIVRDSTPFELIRTEMHNQFVRHFAPELEALSAQDARLTAESAHTMLTLEFIDYLSLWRHLTPDEATEVIKHGLTRILTAV